MIVSKDMFVIMEYTVRLHDGSYVKGENGPASLNFIVGYDQVLPALERSLLGLADGTETEFVIPAREAFGEHDPAQVRARSFDEFPAGRKLEVGKWVIATSTDNRTQYSYYVKAKTDDAAILDFNHPLAGKDLHYHVKIVHIREALPEEIEYLRPCSREEGDDPSPSAS